MNNQKRCILLLLLAMVVGRTVSQTRHTLSIGDTVPDLRLNHIANYSAGQARLADFRGKLLILDFWSVTCKPCIGSMPEMERLQHQFDGQIQIMMVTEDRPQRVKKSAERIANIRSLTLPSYMSDSLLSPLFNFRTVPTHVWIDQRGVVRQITSGYNTTAESISTFLKGETVALPVKEEYKDFNFKEPLWLEGNGRHMKHLQYYSYIMGKINENSGGVSIYEDPQSSLGIHAKIWNSSILHLYKVAFGRGVANNPFHIGMNRVRLQVKDSSRYVEPTKLSDRDNWSVNNAYSYELMLPASHATALYDIMQQDLERFFGAQGTIEKERKKCLVLLRTDSTDRLKATGNQLPVSRFSDPDHIAGLTLDNVPIGELIKQLRLAHYTDTRPVIDRSSYTGNITLHLKSSLNDLKKLRTELWQYGLDLQESEEEIEILVIREPQF